MNCHICSEEIYEGYLCEKHTKELMEILRDPNNFIKEPDWRYHCQICGEFEDRTIVEYPPYGYFCDKDIMNAWEKYR